jgi:malonyl-CoA/methylmalonyl-CoA synthetase
MYQRLFAVAAAQGAGLADLSHLRLLCSGSAPLPPELFDGFRRLTGQTILERYGMTETGMSFSNPYAGERRAGTVGTPLPGVSARIVGADDRPLPDGREGELQVRGSNVFTGYWRDEAKTRASFVADDAGLPWFRTGDLARRDPESGHVTLLGRSRELILRGGYNVYPREIEEVLCAHPRVREAAVAGRPDAEWGEVPVAWLVLEAGDLPDAKADPAELADELTAHCRSHIAGFKVPAAYHVVDALPRNALGKVQKHRLEPPSAA